jgi:hypothetical protein
MLELKAGERVAHIGCGTGYYSAILAEVRRLNKAAVDHVVYAPLGFVLLYQSWRANISGIVKAPVPFFWGVSKAV